MNVNKFRGDIMSLKEQIYDDLRSSMKKRDKVKTSVLSLLKSEIRNVEINQRIDLDDEKVLDVVEKLLKVLLESKESYEQAGKHEDKVNELIVQIEILKKYLPAQMSEQEVRDLIARLIAENAISGKADMGKLMKALMPQIKGKFDGQKASNIVNEMLK